MIANITKKRLLIYTSLSFVVFLILFGSLFTYYLWSKNNELQGKIYPNTYIDGVDVGYKTKSEVMNEFKKKYKKIENVNINVTYRNEKIATFSAEQLHLQRNTREIADHAYLVGRSSHTPSRIFQKVTSLLKLKRYDFNTHIVYDQPKLEEFIKNSEARFNKPASNALFNFQDNIVTSFKADEKGLQLNSDTFRKDFQKTVNELNTNTQNKTVIITDKVLEPDITLGEVNNFGIEELIGVGVSDYTHSAESRVHNLLLATTKFNGVIIPKDATFSFNETVGDISAATGYTQAYVILNGKTVLGDGGGVCQVSTTIFRAALNTGLPIVERHAHAYRVIYYENGSKPGLDATIFLPNVDLKFKNDTGAAILIQTEVDKETNILTFKFYGKKDNRRVEISDVTMSNVAPPPPPAYQDDPTLKRGVVRQTEHANWGATTRFTYKVVKNEKETTSQEFVSYYQPWKAVYLVGVAD